VKRHRNFVQPNPVRRMRVYGVETRNCPDEEDCQHQQYSDQMSGIAQIAETMSRAKNGTNSDIKKYNVQ
jgi:hypothetical protein